jgi:hypothetical protein
MEDGNVIASDLTQAADRTTALTFKTAPIAVGASLVVDGTSLASAATDEIREGTVPKVKI